MLPEEIGWYSYIVGTVLDLDANQPNATITKISEPYTINFAPTLAFDASGQIHVVYGKRKDDHNGIVHKVYTDDFSQVIKKAHWLFSQPQAAIDIRLMKDAQQNLYLSWFEAYLPKERRLQYMNSNQKYRITPLQITGVAPQRTLLSIFTSIAFISALPIIDYKIFCVVFVNFEVLVLILLLYYAIHRLLLFTKWNRITEMLYIPMVILMVVGLLFLLFCLGVVEEDFFKWPLELITEHGLFIVGLSTVALFIFSEFNRFREQEIMYSLFLAYLWIFWIWVILMTMYLPHLNYILPPMI
jgi:hypothetical protein